MTMMPNILLMGPTGTGKTHSIRTIVDAGLETFVIFTEPGMDTLHDVPCEKGLHWAYVPPASPDVNALDQMFQRVATLDYKALIDMKENRQRYAQMRKVLDLIKNARCDRCGAELGSPLDWGTDKALVIDSLTGINVMAMQMATGLKPVRAMQEWQVAQALVENFLNLLCTSTKCLFVLTAHVEREVDEVTGGIQLMASTLGRKLAPKLPRFFSDVILAVRKGREFYWSTAANNVDLKARNVPWAAEIPPTFKQIIEKFKGGEK